MVICSTKGSTKYSVPLWGVTESARLRSATSESSLKMRFCVVPIGSHSHGYGSFPHALDKMIVCPQSGQIFCNLGSLSQ